MATTDPDPETNPDHARLLTRDDLLARLGVSSATLGNWIRSGAFPSPMAVRGARTARWRSEDVHAWEQRSATRANPPQVFCSEAELRAFLGDVGVVVRTALPEADITLDDGTKGWTKDCIRRWVAGQTQHRVASVVCR